MKKLILSVLMLGVMILVSIVGIVSADINGDYERSCVDTDLCTWTLDANSNDNGLPLGSGYYSGCPELGDNSNTFWELGTSATATCTFDGTGLGDTELQIAIDNDVISCTLNEEVILEDYIHNNCAPVNPADGKVVSIIPKSGMNTLVCEILDRGVMSHFDACVIGEYAPCEVIIDKPEEGGWFDSEAVSIEWHLEGACTPLDRFDIWYEKDGDCTLDGSWLNVLGAQNLAPGEVINPSHPNYAYLWNRPPESGEYCIKIKLSSNGARGVSDVFNVDLAPPEVFMTVGAPQVGDCDEGIGDCYINKNTDITLSCEDDNPNKPWQSGPDYIEYRYYFDGGWTGWMTYNSPFSFPEDSEHELEYRCFDKVEKESEHKFKTFIVDTVGPVFTDKQVDEPKFPGCNSIWEECDWYLTQDTEICISYEDPEPHPVNDIEIWCEWTWWETLVGNAFKIGPFLLDETGCFTYDEDSYHELHCWAVDALGNRNESQDLYEADIVDSQLPVTTKWYDGPQYGEEYPYWINGVTTVVLDAVDPEPHPVGVETTYWRNTLVDDVYCETPASGCSNAVGTGDFVEYLEPSTMEESCHLIEYYSVDYLGNTEEVKKQCVFVDKTAPTFYKEVGEPNHDCHGFWETITGECKEHWDWIVTMGTEVEISCVDEGNHPSGVDKLCYRMEWDGEDMTSEECNGGNMEGDYCCVDNDYMKIYFEEECEHTLEFYCVDNVNKTSEIDSKVFKVEGKPFTIELEKKWNLISIPFSLISSNIEEVFNQTSKVEAVWMYDEFGWHVYYPEVSDDIGTIEPGYGYWVKASDATELVVGGSLIQPGANTPPSRQLQEGWNLIGKYGRAPKEAYCTLFSLIDTTIGYPRWSSLVGYNAVHDLFVPMDVDSTMRAGKGYWIEMDVEDTYSPATTCWGFFN